MEICIILKCADLRTVPFPWQSSQLNVKPSRFTLVIFFVPATSAWRLSTAIWSHGPTLATKIFLIQSASILSSVVIGCRCIWGKKLGWIRGKPNTDYIYENDWINLFRERTDGKNYISMTIITCIDMSNWRQMPWQPWKASDWHAQVIWQMTEDDFSF